MEMKPSSGWTKLMPTKPGSWASMACLDGFKAQQRLREDLLQAHEPRRIW